MKIFSLAGRNMKEVYRDPVSMLLGLAMPVALLILFSSIHKKVQLDMFSPQMLTPGVVIFCFAFLIMFSAILLAKDKQSALLTRLFTTPLKSSDFILAYTLPFIPLALFQTVICLIVGALLGATLQNLISALVIFLFAALICISLGMTGITFHCKSGIRSWLRIGNRHWFILRCMDTPENDGRDL